MTRKQKRLSVIGIALAFLGGAACLTLYALGEKASYFYMPAEVQAATLAPEATRDQMASGTLFASLNGMTSSAG